jgi:hypothetical protein
MWQPISSAPYNLDLELAFIDEDGPHALVFPCRRVLDGWINAETNWRINVYPTHWREWRQATAGTRQSEDRARAVSPDHRRALGVLAGSAHGCTQAIMLAHGFSAKMLADLVRDGLATIEPGTVRASVRQIEVMWLMITEAGRQALDQ